MNHKGSRREEGRMHLLRSAPGWEGPGPVWLEPRGGRGKDRDRNGDWGRGRDRNGDWDVGRDGQG